MIKTNGNTSAGRNKFVSPLSAEAKQAAILVNAGASLGRSQSKDKGLDFGDYIAKGFNWLKSGWGDQTGIDTDTFSSTGYNTKGRTVSEGSFKKAGGLGSLFTTLLGGGGGISIGGILSGIGSYFTEKSKAKLAMRNLDIQEALGQEQNAINRLAAEGNIAENKRRTAIGSTFMGWTNPIAQVEGVKSEPGLTVADTLPPKEVNKTAVGALGTSTNGLITQGQQRKVA